MSIYDLSVQAADGHEIPLSDYRGKVLLIVNTATGCGFTPHYEPIEKMYEKYHEQGFEVIDVPCNQFAGQTPGTDDEIHEFCTEIQHAVPADEKVRCKRRKRHTIIQVPKGAERL